MVYGDPQRIRLSHSVVFAAELMSMRNLESEASCYCLSGHAKLNQRNSSVGVFNSIDIRGFAGMSRQIRVMIRQMRALKHVTADDSARYTMVSDCALKRQMRGWAYYNAVGLGMCRIILLNYDVLIYSNC